MAWSDEQQPQSMRSEARNAGAFSAALADTARKETRSRKEARRERRRHRKS